MSEVDKLSRRKFLKTVTVAGSAAATMGALGACTQATPAAPAQPPAAPTCPPAPTAAPAPTCPPVPTAAPAVKAEPTAVPASWDKTADIVIIGAGGAGMAAAIEAVDAGAKVLILEKGVSAGGTTALSGGVIQAAGTKFQKDLAKVADDTAEKHLKYWTQASEGIADPALLKILADNAAGNIDWLVKQGLNYVNVYGVDAIPYITEPGLMAPRIHVPGGAGNDAKPGTGAVHTGALLKVCKAKGVEFMFKTQASDLIRDVDKGVVGVIAQGSDGKAIKVQATRAVILATSSFDWNKDMARAYSPQQLWALEAGMCLCAKTSTGDGIRMAQAVGADLAGMGGTIGLPSIGIGTSLGTQDVPAIFVNKYGQRFVNEAAHYAFTSRAVFEQEEHVVWAVFDEAGKKLGGKGVGSLFGGWSDDLSKELADGTVKTGKTPADLAQAINANPRQLQASVEAWNADAPGGKDTMFGKKIPAAFGAGPFYATRVYEANLGSLGGVKINANAQVLDTAGKPIPHLYAGGVIAGNLFGPYYPGSGTAVAVTVCYGRIAGKNAAGEKPQA